MRRFASLAVFCFAVPTFAQVTDPAQLPMIFRLQEQADRDEALGLALAYGWPIRQEFPDGRIIELAKVWNGRPLYRTTNNVNAAISTRANRVHPGGVAGLTLTGTGVTLGEWDGGSARTSHQELTGRVINVDVASFSHHATHVAGTMIASGVNGAAKGMAWGANLRSHDWNNDQSEMATAALDHNVVASNHSYGYVTGWSGGSGDWYWYGDRVAGHTEDAGFGFYDDSARDWDQIVLSNRRYSVFKSAGNDRNGGPASQPTAHKEYNGTGWITVSDVRPKDGGTTGYDTLPYNATAKNIIVVGAVNDVPSYTGPASVTMSSFSGWGPTDDGRIKPDLVANGVSLTSSIASSDAAYEVMSGTSMSSPNATGSAALVINHYKNKYSGSSPENYVLKTLLLHTADECGANPGPDYAFGWGLLNVEAACRVITEETSGPTIYTRMRLNEVMVNGRTLDRKYTSTGAPVKVTICWNDAPGTPPAWGVDPTARMLKNDLDVRLIRVSDGFVYRPWILDPANPANAATPGDNIRDNVEQVQLPSVPAGEYLVRVTHKGSLTGTVNYALITDGLQYVNAAIQSLFVSPAYVTGGSPASATVTLNGPSYFTATIGLSDSGSPITTPASVAVSPGQYSATASLATLPVSSFYNGTVTATYLSVTRTATLQVMPPFGLQSLALDKAIIIAGETPVTGTVITKAYAPSDTNVAINDTSANLVTPASIIVASGTRVKTFPITSAAVAVVTPVTVNAVLSGVTKSASITLSPPPVLIGMTISPGVVRGGDPITGTLTLSFPAPTGGAVVTLADNTTAIVTPPYKTLTAGATGASFTCTTVPVTTRFRRQITATYRGVTLSRDVILEP